MSPNKSKTMPHRAANSTSNMVCWSLVPWAALLQMSLAGLVLAAGQPQNATSIEQHNNILFHHHHHHHLHHHPHSEDPSTGTGASGTCGTSYSQRNQLEAGEPASLSSSLLRTYIRTNNMRAYHLDLHAYRPEAKFVGDPAFVDSRNEQHQQRCRRHLGHYHRLLKSFRETDPMEVTNSMDSLKLSDAFGRPESGLLEGNQFWLGQYERCLEFKSLVQRDEHDEASGDTTPTQINGQYCLALSQFPSWNPEDTKTSIKIGMCLPETCTSSMLNEQKDLFEEAEQMLKLQLGDGLPFSKLKLRSIYCLPHETSEIRQYTLSGKMLISVMSLFVVFCIYATISDYLSAKKNSSPTPVKALMTTTSQESATCDTDTNEAISSNGTVQEKNQSQMKLVLSSGSERTWRNVFVESFSLIQNFNKITTVKEVRPLESPTIDPTFNKDLFLGSVTGIKCIGLLWIIAAHTFLVGPISHRNLIYLDKLTKTYLANLFLSAHLMVDSFFVLSGVLASYMIFKGGIQNLRMRHWITMTVHRYWRLTPVYLLCYWFAKSLGHLNNSGPLWDYMTAAQSPRLNCANESWLYAILQLSDFKSPKNHCVPFAWFIGNGIKFWMVTPIFLVAIYKSVRRGYALVGASILANCVLVFVLAFNSKVDMKSVIEFKPESADNMLNDMEDIYTRPYSRIGAYLVGIVAGHWFYTIERDQKRLNLSDKAKYLIWAIVSLTMFLFAFVVKIAGGMELDEAAIPWVFSFMSAIIRPVWAVCTCWLVFALAHGHARWLSRFLCARSWSLLGRLSFSAYLVQGEVIANLYLAENHSTPFVYTDMVSKPLYSMAATIAVAFLMTIFVEYPLVGIEELILPPKRPRETKLMENKHESNQTVNKVFQPQQKVTCDHDNHSTITSNGTPMRGDKLKEL